MIPPDAIAATIQYLREDQNIQDLGAGGKIYGVELPANAASTMPDYAVVIRPSGGYRSQENSRTYFQRIDVRCYGKTPFEANRLNYACNYALLSLQNSIKKGAFLYNATMESAGNFAREPEPANWPFVFSVWSIAVNTENF